METKIGYVVHLISNEERLKIKANYKAMFKEINAKKLLDLIKEANKGSQTAAYKLHVFYLKNSEVSNSEKLARYWLIMSNSVGNDTAKSIAKIRSSITDEELQSENTRLLSEYKA